ncbi:unnamed protein product [Anisakis simplex]|uniref:Cadherin domain-containing protein n=1 Tax=Anisakis simplex TaxID=6269 RepID=A0A0M3KI91_ANISI|nr:unnamed protein product [Anisakis simplex]
MKQQQHYSLESAIPFRIDPVEGAIYTTGPLDREQRGEWTLEVKAEDNGRFERRSNSTRLIVVVGDRNDNEPVILNDLYDVFIPQGLQKGDLVHCVRAADADQNDTLTLAIAPAVAGDSDPDESSGFFRIDQRNGAILAARSLEAKDFYRVTVTVADGGGHSSAATFNFYVGGGHGKFGKNFPRFEKPTRSEFVVKEGASSNPITTFRAAPPGRQFITKTKDDDYNSSHRDDNSSQDDVIRYAIACGDRWGAFRIHPSNGQLYATAKLDYELQNRFDLVISARFITPPTDSSQANGYHPQAGPIGGSSLPPLFAYTQVTILVEDLNDNAPIFDQVRRIFLHFATV